MDDLISRQAAIDRIIGTGYADQIKENVIMILMGLPPAEPKRGHWKHVDPIPEKMLGWMPWYCSECGAGVGKHQTAYCPNCGADMRGEQDG